MGSMLPSMHIFTAVVKISDLKERSSAWLHQDIQSSCSYLRMNGYHGPIHYSICRVQSFIYYWCREGKTSVKTQVRIKFQHCKRFL